MINGRKTSLEYPPANEQKAHHHHGCPVCKKRISGTGSTLCYKCAWKAYPQKNFARAIDEADKRKRLNV